MPSYISQGGLSTIEYIQEVTVGTTPATPQTIAIPVESYSSKLNKSFIEDPSLIANNMVVNMLDGNAYVEGNLSVAYRHAQFDDLLAGGMMSTWATNVLKLGNTETAFTFESGVTDSGAARYFVTRGTEVKAFEVSAKTGDAAMLKLDLLGYTFATSTTKLDTTPTAVQTAKLPFTTTAGTLTIDGTSYPISEFSFKVDNGFSPKFTIGSSAPYGLSFEKKSVTGKFVFLNNSNTLLTKYTAGTTAAVVFTLSDGTNTHTWSIPKIKMTNYDTPIQAGALTVSVDFTAVYDSTSSTILQVTRT